MFHSREIFWYQYHPLATFARTAERRIVMDEYISREAVINITAETGAWETQNRVRELPAADVQPVK